MSFINDKAILLYPDEKIIIIHCGCGAKICQFIEIKQKSNLENSLKQTTKIKPSPTKLLPNLSNDMMDTESDDDYEKPSPTKPSPTKTSLNKTSISHASVSLFIGDNENSTKITSDEEEEINTSLLYDSLDNDDENNNNNNKKKKKKRVIDSEDSKGKQISCSITNCKRNRSSQFVIKIHIGGSPPIFICDINDHFASDTLQAKVYETLTPVFNSELRRKTSTPSVSICQNCCSRCKAVLGVSGKDQTEPLFYFCKPLCLITGLAKFSPNFWELCIKKEKSLVNGKKVSI